jgi:hypothetical protein
MDSTPWAESFVVLHLAGPALCGQPMVEVFGSGYFNEAILLETPGRRSYSINSEHQ